MRKRCLLAAVGAVTPAAVLSLTGAVCGQQPVQLQVRFVPQTGGFGAATPLTLAGPVNGPVSLGTTPAARTLRFRLDYRIVDLIPADSIHPSGLAATSFLSITAATTGATAGSTVARGLLSTFEAVSLAVPPAGAPNAGITGNTGNDTSNANASGWAGMANPFRGGFSAPNDNTTASNGVVSGLNITGILPITITQFNQGYQGYDDGSGNPAFPLTGNEWYPMYVFTFSAGNADVGSVTFTTSIMPDPGTGNTFLYFANGQTQPQSISNPNSGSASITVNIPAIPAPGAVALPVLGLIITARRRRS